MTIEIDMDFILENDINVEQYVLCYLLYEDKLTADASYREAQHQTGQSSISYLYRYFDKTNDSESLEEWKKKDINHLVDLGFLKNSNPKGKWSADHMEATEEFVEAVFKHKEAFWQLLEVYPSWMRIEKGRPKVSLKTGNMETLESTYNRLVKTKKLHRKILKLVKWAKGEGQLNLGIEKFVTSMYWNRLEELYRDKLEEVSGDKEDNILLM